MENIFKYSFSNKEEFMGKLKLYSQHNSSKRWLIDLQFNKYGYLTIYEMNNKLDDQKIDSLNINFFIKISVKSFFEWR